MKLFRTGASSGPALAGQEASEVPLLHLFSRRPEQLRIYYEISEIQWKFSGKFS